MTEAIWPSSHPSASRPIRICSRRSSYASETYFRNTSPRITSLYWCADSEPRSLSAAFQSVSLSSFIVDGAVGAAFARGGTGLPALCGGAEYVGVGFGGVNGDGSGRDAVHQCGDQFVEAFFAPPELGAVLHGFGEPVVEDLGVRAGELGYLPGAPFAAG